MLTIVWNAYHIAYFGEVCMSSPDRWFDRR